MCHDVFPGVDQFLGIEAAWLYILVCDLQVPPTHFSSCAHSIDGVVVTMDCCFPRGEYSAATVEKYAQEIERTSEPAPMDLHD